jgi:hypothetical protein
VRFQAAYLPAASQALVAAGLQYALPGLTAGPSAAAAAAVAAAAAASSQGLVAGDLSSALQAASQGVAAQTLSQQVGLRCLHPLSSLLVSSFLYMCFLPTLRFPPFPALSLRTPF